MNDLLLFYVNIIYRSSLFSDRLSGGSCSFCHFDGARGVPRRWHRALPHNVLIEETDICNGRNSATHLPADVGSSASRRKNVWLSLAEKVLVHTRLVTPGWHSVKYRAFSNGEPKATFKGSISLVTVPRICHE